MISDTYPFPFLLKPRYALTSPFKEVGFFPLAPVPSILMSRLLSAMALLFFFAELALTDALKGPHPPDTLPFFFFLLEDFDALFVSEASP